MHKTDVVLDKWQTSHSPHCSFVGGHRPSKIMRFVDKIAKSKYFQKATETEFIKKKMEEVSNTPLLLTVEVQECRGTLAVNIPPPPTDRIWYVQCTWVKNAHSGSWLESAHQLPLLGKWWQTQKKHSKKKIVWMQTQRGFRMISKSNCISFYLLCLPC